MNLFSVDVVNLGYYFKFSRPCFSIAHFWFAGYTHVIFILQMPPKLLIQVPRFGKQFKTYMYKRIVPDKTLNMSKLVHTDEDGKVDLDVFCAQGVCDFHAIHQRNITLHTCMNSSPFPHFFPGHILLYCSCLGTHCMD